MPETKVKFDCYKCEYRGGVAGSCHSSCNHPAVKSEKEDPLLNIMAIFASVGRVDPVVISKLGIEGNPHGIAKGWFNWPFNFDPTWLENCDGCKFKK